jgi:hypothetical protein
MSAGGSSSADASDGVPDTSADRARGLDPGEADAGLVVDAPADGVDEGEPDSAPIPEVTAEAELAAALAVTDAQRVLWPWVARRTRAQVVSLVVISCLALGPLVALISILRADPTPVHVLLEATPAAPDVSRITATALGLSPAAGELRVRILVDPADGLTDDSGRLDRPVALVINDVSGATTRSYAQGDTPTPFEIALPLSEGSTTRYPFDRYRGSLFIVLNDDSGTTAEQLLVALEARSVIDDFALDAALPADSSSGPRSVTVVDWTARRSATTTVYAIWLMLLMWALAVTGLLIIWAVVIWMVEIPFWAFGYFVGVLFALPPLRDSLPGRPPPGTIFDYGSFYWSVTISGINLILILAIWLRRTHAKERLRSIDPTRPG